MAQNGGSDAGKFLSTPSARRATQVYAREHGQGRISIHALREEGDPAARTQLIMRHVFLSTPSARRATEYACFIAARAAFLSTPSARRATVITGRYGDMEQISIHALREEGDTHPAISHYR